MKYYILLRVCDEDDICKSLIDKLHQCGLHNSTLVNIPSPHKHGIENLYGIENLCGVEITNEEFNFLKLKYDTLSVYAGNDKFCFIDTGDIDTDEEIDRLAELRRE